jgi:putative chitinase
MRINDIIVEGFDQPYPLKWQKGDHGDLDALARLPDGSPLSIMFNQQQNDDGDESTQVEFYRNNSQEVTGEGDAQRIFATVLAAIQQYIKKRKPASLTFSASKEVDPDQNSESRAKLYDRLVQRYSRAWGYRAFRADNGNLVMYELSRLKPRVAEDLDETLGNDLGEALENWMEMYSTPQDIQTILSSPESEAYKKPLAIKWLYRAIVPKDRDINSIKATGQVVAFATDMQGAINFIQTLQIDNDWFIIRKPFNPADFLLDFTSMYEAIAQGAHSESYVKEHEVWMKPTAQYTSAKKNEIVFTSKEYYGESITEEELEEGWKDWVAGAALGAAALSPQISTAKVAPIQQPAIVQPAKVDTAAATKLVLKPEAKVLIKTAQAAGMKGKELAQFVAQCAHETSNFSSLKEKGGKLDFKKYDPVHNPRKAKILGNKVAGDGAKYHGRGYIQLTGRDNYKRAGKALGLPLEAQPEMVEQPEIAAKVAVWFWQNQVAPKVDNFNDTAQVTKPINSGLRGLEDRQNKFAGISALMAPKS